MTTQEKEISIAEMLGYKFYSKYLELGRSDGNPTVELPNFIDIFGQSIQAPALKFHSDANWQLKALKFITKKYDAAWKLTSKFCEIHNHNNGFDCRCEINCPENPLMDMFECLFQFSQYILKQKK